jgi:MFS transporter, MHS family, proline/betaine transporter
VGILAPIIIVFARLLQGFSAGGEMGSATAFMTAYVPKERRRFFLSWIQSGIGLGVVVGAVIVTGITTQLSDEAIHSWGWRVPFLLGAALGPIGYFIRTKVVDPSVFKSVTDRSKAPLRDIIRDFPRETIISFALVILWTVCWYILLFYIPTYTTKFLGLPAIIGFISVITGGLMIFGLCPVFGWLSDRIGHKKMLTASSLAILLLAYPMFWFINKTPSLLSLIIFQVVLALFLACYEGAVLVAFTKMFPDKVLSTGISVAYNLGVLAFGGFAAFIITWLISVTGNNLAPALYLIVAAALSFTAALQIKEKTQHG